jgi:hypothetical protein
VRRSKQPGITERWRREHGAWEVARRWWNTGKKCVKGTRMLIICGRERPRRGPPLLRPDVRAGGKQRKDGGGSNMWALHARSTSTSSQLYKLAV